MEVNRKRPFAEKNTMVRREKKITEKEEWLKQEIFGQKGENDEDWMRKKQQKQTRIWRKISWKRQRV